MPEEFPEELETTQSTPIDNSHLEDEQKFMFPEIYLKDLLSEASLEEVFVKTEIKLKVPALKEYALEFLNLARYYAFAHKAAPNNIDKHVNLAYTMVYDLFKASSKNLNLNQRDIWASGSLLWLRGFIQFLRANFEPVNQVQIDIINVLTEVTGFEEDYSQRQPTMNYSTGKSSLPRTPRN